MKKQSKGTELKAKHLDQTAGGLGWKDVKGAASKVYKSEKVRKNVRRMAKDALKYLGDYLESLDLQQKPSKTLEE